MGAPFDERRKIVPEEGDMKIEIAPADLTRLLKQVSPGRISKKKRAELVILAARRNKVTVRSETMAATHATAVETAGQCRVNRTRLIEILETYAAKHPIVVSLTGVRLLVGTFSMEVSPCTYAEIPNDASLSADTRVSKQKTARRTPPVTASTNYDCTGESGSVNASDEKDCNKAIVCPICQSVGYFEKFLHRGKTYRRSVRSWASHTDAHELVVLLGDEEEKMCPTCLSERLQRMGYEHLPPLKQADMFP